MPLNKLTVSKEFVYFCEVKNIYLNLKIRAKLGVLINFA